MVHFFTGIRRHSLQLVIIVVCCVSTAQAEDGVSRTEFEAFVQRYEQTHTPKPAKPSKFSVKPYGYINLSASYETERTTTGDYCVYANSPELDDDAGFHIDPKSTRLGLKVNGVGLPCWQRSGTEAVVEVDFQGAFQSRNRGGLLLRKAYVSVSDGSTKLQAGQDWEVISPLYPKTLNYTAGACVGNVGYRRGMLRVDHRLDFHNSSDLTFQFALTDNVFRDNSAVVPASSRWPILQGRLAYSFGKDFFRAGPVTLGVSSHLGEQRYEFAGHRKFLKTWSLNVDANIPLTEKLGFQMEYFVGENLANIEGGILQGVDLVRGDTIRAQGGWAGLQYRWTKKLETNLCYLIDDPKNSDVIAGNSSNHLARNYNHCIFLNVLYNWSDALMTGFEVSFWRTHWQRYDPVSGTVTPLAPGKPTRLEFVTRYTF